MKITSIASLIFVLIFLGCKEESKKDSERIVKDYQEIASRADSAWDSMISSDDAKILNMDRLASELLLLDQCDSSALLESKRIIQQLSGYRYSKENLLSPGLIDRYDSLTNEAIGRLRKEISRNPKAIEFQLINQLSAEVTSADDSVIFLRKNYDQLADELNAFTEKHKIMLSSVKDGKVRIEKRGVFRVNP